MHDRYFENNIVCGSCRVTYPGHRRTCPCCNEYNPEYLAEPEGDFYNNDWPEEEVDLSIPGIFTYF